MLTYKKCSSVSYVKCGHTVDFKGVIAATVAVNLRPQSSGVLKKLAVILYATTPCQCEHSKSF